MSHFKFRITLFSLLLTLLPVRCYGVDMKEPGENAAPGFTVLEASIQSDGLSGEERQSDNGDIKDDEDTEDNGHTNADDIDTPSDDGDGQKTDDSDKSSEGRDDTGESHLEDLSVDSSSNDGVDGDSATSDNGGNGGQSLSSDVEGQENMDNPESDGRKSENSDVVKSGDSHSPSDNEDSGGENPSSDGDGQENTGNPSGDGDESGNSDGVDNGNPPSDNGDNRGENPSSDEAGQENTGTPSGETSGSGDSDGGDSDDNTPVVPRVEVHATDIDVGDVSPVTLGTSQVLSVTLIPVNSTDTITYTSLTPEIASVNQLGRVRGLAIGTASIQISAGEITQVVSVPIVQEETDEDKTPEPVTATAVDVEYQETMDVGTTQVLVPSLLPSNADSSVHYSSDNSGVATVNEFGRVSAIAPGVASITVTAGDAQKSIRIRVKGAVTVEAMDFGEVPTEMTVGTSQTLSVSILPSEAADQTVSYHSSNSDILDVNSFGRVIARKPGTATITASTGGARCHVTITVNDTVHVEQMDFGEAQTEMTVGTSQTLAVNILPAEASNETITYRSSNSNILEINSFGRVLARNEGTATITAYAGEARCSVSITVKPVVQVEKMDFGDAQTEMIVGSSQTLSVSILPVDAADQTVIYHSSDPDTLEVNSFGRVIARKTGIATITAVSGNAECSLLITVKEEAKAEDIEFSDVQTQMVLGSSQLLNVSILPTEVSNKTVSYFSSNESVVSVNPFGRASALELGTADVTASVDQVSKTIKITVVARVVPNDIDFELPDSELLLGSSVNLGATVLPTNAEDQTIRYSSSDPAILTVNAAGKVTGRQLGAATVFLEAGDVKKSVTIYVVEEVTVNNIEVSEFNKKMKVDSTQTLSTSVFPTDAKNQTISFSSSNTSVATVSAGGVITARATGTTTIILKAGKAEKRLNLTVYVATDEIQIPENYLILHPSDQYQVYATVKPSGADQNVTYRSTDSSVARVTADGLVTAVSVGRSSIILENDDSMATITVIVNKGNVIARESKEDVPQNMSEDTDSDLVKIIREAGSTDTITESGSYYPYITNDILLALYQTQKTLRITYEKYNILVSGSDIRNVNNEFPTEITLQETKQGITFAVSENSNLPGNIEVDFTNIPSDYRYLYLYNEATAKYERLNMASGQRAEIETPGNYLLTTKKLRSISWPVYSSIAAGGLLLVGAGVYIVTKKKYWFW